MGFILEAGWPIYFVMACSAVALVTGVRFVLGQRSLSAVVASGTATLIFGVMGLVFGLAITLQYIVQIPPDDRSFTFLMGLKESMRNLELAIAVVAAQSALVLVGMARRTPSEPKGIYPDGVVAS